MGIFKINLRLHVAWAYGTLMIFNGVNHIRTLIMGKVQLQVIFFESLEGTKGSIFMLFNF